MIVLLSPSTKGQCGAPRSMVMCMSIVHLSVDRPIHHGLISRHTGIVVVELEVVMQVALFDWYTCRIQFGHTISIPVHVTVTPTL